MIEQLNNQDLGLWQLYLLSLKSPQTREKYTGRMEKFFDFVGIEGKTIEDKSIHFIEKSRVEGEKRVFNSFLKFMLHLLDRVSKKEIVGSTVQNYVNSIKLFCELAEISVAWKKITRGLPKGKGYADDRIPTDEEIQRIIEYPDRRIKAIVCTMVSSGIRLGAWDYLRWGDIKPISREGQGIVAAKKTVYAVEDEEYFTFISKEAYMELQDWIKYREISGEIVKEGSWVMRNFLIQGLDFLFSFVGYKFFKGWNGFNHETKKTCIIRNKKVD